MDSPTSRRILGFYNPVTQSVGGSAYNPTTQGIKVEAPVYAIAIAPDSMVDVVDLYPVSANGVGARIRVSVQAPWFGCLPDGMAHVAVPVRLMSGVGVSGQIDGNTAAAVPSLTLEIHTTPPGDLRRRRAPMFVQTTFGPGVTSATYVLPTAGRDRVRGIIENTDSNGDDVTLSVYGVLSVIAGDGTGSVSSAAFLIHGPTVIGDQEVATFDLDVAPYEYVQISAGAPTDMTARLNTWTTDPS